MMKLLKLNFWAVLLALFSADAFGQYNAEFSERMSSPKLLAPGERQIYSGEYLEAISIPIGGIGAGTIQMNGKAERHFWQIFNNFEKIELQNSFFAIRTNSAGDGTAVRVLQTESIGDFQAMNDLTFSGEYPFAWYHFKDNALPVDVTMEAFNPLIPMDTKNSSIPTSIYTFTATNTSNEDVEVSFLSTQQNVIGIFDEPSSEGIPEGTLIEDFEVSDYGEWVATGNAFDSGPSHGSYNNQSLSGFLGNGLVNTYDKVKDAGTGTLKSPEIDINTNYMYFLIGGGNHPNETCINLIIDGKTVKTATGYNTNAMRLVSWDISAYKGKIATIEIVDTQTGGWGHICIDHILLSDHPFHPGLGGNVNELFTDNGITTLSMTTNKSSSNKGFGSMALACFDAEAQGTADWESTSSLYNFFLNNELITPTAKVGPSEAGKSVKGALLVPFTLKPGESRSVTFALSWHFPNAQHGVGKWSDKGNQYANWWDNAMDVSSYIAKNLDYLIDKSHLFNQTFYNSNIPHWLLDRIISQTANLRSKTVFWGKNGYFGGWEGCFPTHGWCAGNCTHVWHYAQSHARLFPDIGKQMRKEALNAQSRDGGIKFRLHIESYPAIDGQCGEIIQAYREHLINRDHEWLNENYPKIKKAMEYVIERWDSDKDGMLYGKQHNTLDCDIDGSSSWIGSLYLTALAASVKMAELQNDTEAAALYKTIWDAGVTNQNKILWNGEYYNSIAGEEHRQDYLNGCHIDQVLGVWWAKQLDLPSPYPADKVEKAMQALINSNFVNDFAGFNHKYRKFVNAGDAGLMMITWPNNDKPENTMYYYDEVMTGFEYSAAATMIQHEMIEEGLAIIKAISERYNGKLREGLSRLAWGYSGNPFGDDEAGKFYARAMSIWSVLTSLQGFIYDGPNQKIGFKPLWKKDNHSSFFTASEGWGLFSQKQSGNLQKEVIEVSFGKLIIRQFLFEIPNDMEPVGVAVHYNGSNISTSYTNVDNHITILVNSPLTVTEGEKLLIDIQLK